MKAAVYTLGCKLNQCESEALASSFDSRGFFIGRVNEEADIYIINTCTVTSKAEQKARRMIRKLSAEHPESVVLVTGCYAQLDSDDLLLGDNVVVVPHDYKDEVSRLPAYISDLQSNRAGLQIPIVELVKRYFPTSAAESSVSSRLLHDPDRFWYDSVDFNYHTRAFLKIQDGCDNSCAYCRVTIARGAAVSLDMDMLLKQFELLCSKGYREIVLTGVNLTSYSSRGMDFAALLGVLTEKASSMVHPPRIRISSLEPETIDERMAAAVENPLVCPHFHISVQSGSNSILSAMRRRNTREKIVEGVNLLRSVKDDPFFAADVIAGFPGESEVDFRLTMDLLDNCDFSFLHVFPFSPRPGTAAAVMKNQVPERISGERTALLRRLSAEKSAAYSERWVGREVDVLLEKRKAESWYGTSGNYLKSEVCDIINNDGGICRATVEAVTGDGVACRFKEYI